MPVLKKKTEDGKTDEWYLHIPNKNGNDPPVYTIQVEEAGRDLLLSLDLDHNATPKRAADIDWDLFYTLDDLGLLYTYNSDYTPGDAVPDSQSFDRLDGVSDTQRAQFARLLLDRYELESLCQHDHILRFLLSLKSLPELERHDLLEVILADTPFDVSLIDDPSEAFSQYVSHFSAGDASGYNPFALAVFTACTYDVLADNPDIYNDVLASNEGKPVWVWDDWVAFGGTELMFYAVDDPVMDALPTPVTDCIVDEAAMFDGRVYNVFECELSALSMAQTITAMSNHNWVFSEVAKAGLQTGDGVWHCLILPRPQNHSATVPGVAIDEAATEAESEGAQALRSMFAEVN